MKKWLLVLVGILMTLALAAHADQLGKTTIILDGRKAAQAETNLGNFIADAVRNSSGTDIAILHAMALRANALIDAGGVDEVAFRDVLASPSSKITVLKLTPSVLRAVLQRALTKYPDSNLAFLQFSGMTVTFDSAQPAATRLKSITINNKDIDLTDTKTTYKVAMPRELAMGAAGYSVNFSDDIVKTMVATDTTLLDAVKQEFDRQKGAISPKVDERLKDLAKKDDKNK